MDISIRTTQNRDLRALLGLYAHLHATDAAIPDEPQLEQIWNQFLSDPKLHCFVAEFNSELIASCTLAVVPNLTHGARPYGLIENVVTHADYRRRGVGTRLLRYALQVAWQYDCYKVMLLTGRTHLLRAARLTSRLEGPPARRPPTRTPRVLVRAGGGYPLGAAARRAPSGCRGDFSRSCCVRPIIEWNSTGTSSSIL